MDKTEREELEKAYRKEKDSGMVFRMLAVYMVHVRKMSIGETATNLMRAERWVCKWLERFDTGGLDGLRDLPRTGWSPKIPREIIARITGRSVQPKCTPRELQKMILGETGTKLHITNVRNIIHRYGPTPKVPQKAHINRASRGAVRSWQYRFDRRVWCLDEKGFTILDMDEAFFVYDVASERKYWFPRGEQIVVPYTRSHKRIAVYGAIAMDGRQLFRTRRPFDAPTLVWRPEELQRRFGKVVIDRASPHRAKAVKKLLQENKTPKSPSDATMLFLTASYL